MSQATALRMDPTVEQALREVDWADLGMRLTAYAVWKARNLAWRYGRGELSLGARTPDDLAAVHGGTALELFPHLRHAEVT